MKLYEILGKVNPEMGDVGIELEIEGDVPEYSNSRFWKSVHDGSLRGGLEYVTKGAIKADQVKDAMLRINRFFCIKEASPVFSFRTSTHIHVNVLHLTPRQILNVAFAYYMLEPFLIKASGELRKGNRFCLSARDSEGQISIFSRYIRNSSNSRSALAQIIRTYREDALKYVATNLCRLRDLGTIEIRTLEGTLDVNRVEEWTNTLVSIRDFAASCENFKEVADKLIGGEADKILPDSFKGEDFESELQLQRSLLISIEFSEVSLNDKDIAVQDREQVGERAFNYFPDAADYVAWSGRNQLNSTHQGLIETQTLYRNYDGELGTQFLRNHLLAGNFGISEVHQRPYIRPPVIVQTGFPANAFPENRIFFAGGEEPIRG